LEVSAPDRPVTQQYPLGALALDEELQPREEIDPVLLGEFGEAIAAGAMFPPVVAVNDGETLWLADGYHRWHAHAALELSTISCTVFDGTREEALRYSLQANATHGKRPTKGDIERAYRIAAANRFIEPWDVEGVVAVLKCSDRWARTLTQPARARKEADRAAEILRLKDAGTSNREIARQTGVPSRTVDRAVAPKRHNAEMAQPCPVPGTPGDREQQAARAADARELFGSAGQNWSAVLRALRTINALAPVEDLFAARFRGFDHHLVGELATARAWMTEFGRSFDSDQDD
jgi:ParB-like nuclease domain/Homeodomain-like domain